MPCRPARLLLVATCLAFVATAHGACAKDLATPPSSAPPAAANDSRRQADRLSDADFARLLDTYVDLFDAEIRATREATFETKAEMMAAFAQLGAHKRPMHRRVDRAADKLGLAREAAWRRFREAQAVGELSALSARLAQTIAALPEWTPEQRDAIDALPEGDLLAEFGGKCEQLLRRLDPALLVADRILLICLDHSDAELDCLLAADDETPLSACAEPPPELSPAAKQRQAELAAARKNPSGIAWRSADEFPNPVRRPVIVVFEAAWCAPCVNFQTETFADARVANEIGERFDAVLVDMTEAPSGAAEALVNRFEATGLPAVYLLDSSGQVAAHVNTFESADEFLPRLKAVR